MVRSEDASLVEKWLFLIAFFDKWKDKWRYYGYVNKQGNSDTHLGYEIDFQLKYDYTRGLEFQFIYACFMAVDFGRYFVLIFSALAPFKFIGKALSDGLEKVVGDHHVGFETRNHGFEEKNLRG